MPHSLTSSRTRSSWRGAVARGPCWLGVSSVLRASGISDPMICLLCNSGAVRRGKSRFEGHQQLMQGQERAQRYLWKADLEASAIDRVELPRRHDRHDARHQLDVDELASGHTLALTAAP